MAAADGVPPAPSSSSAPPTSTSGAGVEQWDLTPLVAPYLDRHMVLPLLEFLKERVENGTLSYPMHDLDQARLDLVRPTHMVDYAEDLYKSLHGHSTTPDAIPAQQLEAQKKDVYTQLEALKQQCEKLDKFPEEEKATLVASGKWTVSHLSSTLGISLDMIETYRQLARFYFECGDYKMSLHMVSNYIALHATPPPPNTASATPGGAGGNDDDDEFVEQPQYQTKGHSSSSDAVGNPNMYYLKQVDLKLLQVLWGRLACEILVEDYAAASIAVEAVKTAMESLVSNQQLSALDALQQRTWLLHWSLFVYWNDPASSSTAAASTTAAATRPNAKANAKGGAGTDTATVSGGLEQLVELFHSDKYKQAITTNAPHLLRYLTAAVLLCKRRVVGKKTSTANTAEARRLLKNLVYVMQDCEYTDPIVEFVNCLCVKYDFDSAQVKLAECEQVLGADFFLCHQTALFMEEARVFVFEHYCRIHNKIDLHALGEKLAMDRDDAERWIVDLIRNADLDAKIDADEGCVIMGGTPLSIYEQVMDRTRDLNARSANVAQNLNALLNEARKEKAKRERAAKYNDDEY